MILGSDSRFKIRPMSVQIWQVSCLCWSMHRVPLINRIILVQLQLLLPHCFLFRLKRSFFSSGTATRKTSLPPETKTPTANTVFQSTFHSKKCLLTTTEIMIKTYSGRKFIKLRNFFEKYALHPFS